MTGVVDGLRALRERLLTSDMNGLQVVEEIDALLAAPSGAGTDPRLAATEELMDGYVRRAVNAERRARQALDLLDEFCRHWDSPGALEPIYPQLRGLVDDARDRLRRAFEFTPPESLPPAPARREGEVKRCGCSVYARCYWHALDEAPTPREGEGQTESEGT